VALGRNCKPKHGYACLGHFPALDGWAGGNRQWRRRFTRLTTKDREKRLFLLNSLQEHWREPF
jgi:hypothetical protein